MRIKAESMQYRHAHCHVTEHVSLIAVAMWMKRKAIWDDVSKKVTVAQKTVRDQPTDKLLAALVAILSGAHGLVEVNTRLRSDHALC